MALGNWADVAFDLEGKPRAGVFRAPTGLRIEIYKNWVYVKRGGSVIMETASCDLNVRMVDACSTTRLVASRTNGVLFVAVLHADYSAAGQPTAFSGMVGLGCYGYEGDEWVGVREQQLEGLTAFVRGVDAAVWPCPPNLGAWAPLTVR